MIHYEEALYQVYAPLPFYLFAREIMTSPSRQALKLKPERMYVEIEFKLIRFLKRRTVVTSEALGSCV